MDRNGGTSLPGSQSERPGGQAIRGEPMPDSLAQVDPVMQRFQEAPYDELASAAGGGRLIGLSATSISLRGWMRPIAYLVSLSLLAFFGVTLDLIAGQILQTYEGGRDILTLISAAAVGLPFGIAGILILWRLVTTRHRDTSERTSAGA